MDAEQLRRLIRRIPHYPFPLRVPKQPVGEAPPTCAADYAGQVRTFVDIPGYADGIYRCEPGGTTWEEFGAAGGYTNEMAQDAVGAMLADTASITLTYTDATPELKADAIFGTSAGTVAEGDHTHAAGSGGGLLHSLLLGGM